MANERLIENGIQQKPGVVIFTAILSFLSAFAWFLLSFIFTAALIFGNLFKGLQTYAADRVEQWSQAHAAAGLNVIFGSVTAFSTLFALFFLILGVGLLKGKGWAWYLEVAVSVAAAFLFIPIGTVMSAVILYFLFQPEARKYFRV